MKKTGSRVLAWILLICVPPIAAKAQSLQVTHLAGSGGGDYVDAKGSAARFNRPLGGGLDSAGNFYVADSSNQVIRKVAPDGTVSTLAGTPGVFGYSDGPGSAAKFSLPQGVVTDDAGSVYVADSGNRVIRKITPDGVVSTLAGAAGITGSVDGTGTAAQFVFPCGLARDLAGNLYVTDSSTDGVFLGHGGSSTIRKVTLDGVVTTIAGSSTQRGFEDGPKSVAQFDLDSSGALVVDPAGNIFVADSANNAIRKVTPDGTVTTLAGGVPPNPCFTGQVDGTGSAACFGEPLGITRDTHGNVYVGDGFTGSAIRKVTPDGVVTTLAGSKTETGLVDGIGGAARFNGPVLFDSDGVTIYAPDVTNNAMRKVVMETGAVTTLAGGSPIVTGSSNGVGGAATFNQPRGLGTDGLNVFVADAGNRTIRRIIPSIKEVTTSAGTPGVKGSQDGTGAAATFGITQTLSMAGTPSTLYLADSSNNTIRKMTIGSFQVTTLAGTAGQTGSADGVGAAARFTRPQGVALAGTTLYITDSGNSTIRAMDLATATVTTLAGAAGQTGSADGTRSTARFTALHDITTDGTNLYVTDGSTLRVLSLTNDQVATLAGTAGVRGNADGVGTTAEFNAPTGITNDGSSLYVLDSQTIRRVVIATGQVTTVAGQPGWSGGEDGSGPGPRFWGPMGIVYESISNALFIADSNNNTIRQAVCGADSPKDLAIAPMGNPVGPITGVDYLDLFWAPQFQGLIPNSYEWAINGDPFSAPTPDTTATAPPRGSNDPITLHVRTRACSPEVTGTATDSQVYSPAPPVASFSVSGSGSTFTFTDTSTPQATSWLWLFGDGGFDTTQSVMHTYSSAGTYSVVLIATNGAGSNSTSQNQRAGAAGISVAGAMTLTTFDTSDPRRQVLPAVTLTGAKLHVVPDLPARGETIVYLRLLDDAGRVAKERRLSVVPGQEAVYDLGSYGLNGTWSLELVSTRKFEAFVEQRTHRTIVVERTPR